MMSINQSRLGIFAGIHYRYPQTISHPGFDILEERSVTANVNAAHTIAASCRRLFCFFIFIMIGNLNVYFFIYFSLLLCTADPHAHGCVHDARLAEGHLPLREHGAAVEEEEVPAWGGGVRHTGKSGRRWAPQSPAARLLVLCTSTRQIRCRDAARGTNSLL